MKIHYEQAFIGDPEILKAVCVKMFPNVDAPGLNKDEVAQILDVYGWTKLARKIRAKCSAYTIYEGAEVILRMFKLKRVTIHTRDFVLSLLKPAYE